MDLKDLNDQLPKPWMNPNLNDTYCATLDCGTLSTSGNPANGNYDPSVTAGTSLSAISNGTHAQYFRVGNNVHVSGSFRATVTGTSPLAVFSITLPPGSSSSLSDYRSASASGGSTTAGFLPLVYRDMSNNSSTSVNFLMNTFSNANQGAGPYTSVFFNYSLVFQSST